MKTLSLIMSTLLVNLALNAFGAALPSMVQGPSAVTSKDVRVAAEAGKGLVVVFLSAACPCSNSHIEELIQLAKLHPKFNFVGVHSNGNEDAEMAKSYFTNSKLPFPVIRDSQAQIADQFKALKTPHAFIINAEGSLVYQGGVSNSAKFDQADRRYLREALEDLARNEKVKTPEGRTLGCMISRGT